MINRDDFDLIRQAIEEIRERIIDLEYGSHDKGQGWKVQLTWTPVPPDEEKK